jgi:hypothetical protein
VGISPLFKGTPRDVPDTGGKHGKAHKGKNGGGDDFGEEPATGYSGSIGSRARRMSSLVATGQWLGARNTSTPSSWRRSRRGPPRGVRNDELECLLLSLMRTRASRSPLVMRRNSPAREDTLEVKDT